MIKYTIYGYYDRKLMFSAELPTAADFQERLKFFSRNTSNWTFGVKATVLLEPRIDDIFTDGQTSVDKIYDDLMSKLGKMSESVCRCVNTDYLPNMLNSFEERKR